MLLWASITLILLFIVGIVVWNLRTPEPAQIVRFDYDIPKGQQLNTIRLSLLAVSPDGRHIVYSTRDGLFVRSIDQLDARLLPGTKNSIGPFFKPDGQWIGFASQDDGKLKKIHINGVAPDVLCDIDIYLGAIWYTDDTIVYGDMARGIMRISANGGSPQVLVEQQPTFLASPQILPDGKSLIFNHLKPDMENDIVVRSLESGEEKVLFPGVRPRYLPTGHLIYGVESQIRKTGQGDKW